MRQKELAEFNEEEKDMLQSAQSAPSDRADRPPTAAPSHFRSAAEMHVSLRRVISYSGSELQDRHCGEVHWRAQVRDHCALEAQLLPPGPTRFAGGSDAALNFRMPT